jgi:amidohydrolase
MDKNMPSLIEAAAAGIEPLLHELEAIYLDLHQHPELSMLEVRTAGIAADRIERLGYEVTRDVGQTGVVGVLRNGEGPVVMLRADMDGLPVTEATGLPYASKVTAKDADGVEVGVAHACGHDFHVTWLLGAAELLMKHRDAWSGTVLVVFQPGEEIGRGAGAMMDDGMASRFPKPDIILGQHVMIGPAGTVGYRSGPILAAADSLKVKLFGRGAHGSMPHTSVDPVVLAASTVLRLQTIVSRELNPEDSAVLTIGSLQAGTKENIIPDDATLKLNMRTYDEDVREYMLGAIRRICCAECTASGAPREPEFSTLNSFPLTVNDAAATAHLAEAFTQWFGARVFEAPRATGSEDFGVFGTKWGVPSVFWFTGGTDPQVFAEAQANKTLNKIPSNHSPLFAPVIHPTLRTGLEALLCAASAWLGKLDQAS